MPRKTQSRLAMTMAVVLLGGAGGALLWPKKWSANAPMTHTLFGWGIDASSETKLRERLLVPAGYQLNTYATGLGQARIMRWTSAGDLLVSIPRKGEVTLIARDAGHDGRSDGQRALLTGLNRPHGLELRGGYLYIAETDAVVRVPFDEPTGQVQGPIERVLAGLPGGGNHWSRTLREGPDGALYVSVGSSCNVCIEEDQRRAALLRVKPDGTGTEIFASGLRNTVGFDWDPATGELWGVDNGRDLLGDDIPPCELNHLERGKFYGFPFLYGENQPDPELGKTPDPRIAAAVPPVLGFPAHVAPLSLKFLRGASAPPGLEGAALVTFHGSWNRSKKQGYEVVSLHFHPDGRVEMRPFVTGFQRDDDVIGRPVDTTLGPDGAIYISDDYAGAIYRVSYGAAMAAKPETGPAAAAATPAAAPTDDAAVARGRRLFATTGCKNCHAPDSGKPLVVLKALSGRHGPDSLVALLTTPSANMPIFPLKDDEKRDLAAYLLATYR